MRQVGFPSVGGSRGNYGLDLATPIGTPVRAVAAGIVRNVQIFSGWGRTVVITHTLPNGQEYVSLYAHLSKFSKGLKVGIKVARSDIIALSGNSGRSLGPHLHLEIRNIVVGREPLNRRTVKVQKPLDPLRVLDVFHVFVEPGRPAQQKRRRFR